MSRHRSPSTIHILLLIVLSLFLLFGSSCQAASVDEIQKAASAQPDNVLELDEKSYKQFVDTEREYAVVVLFTVTSPEFKCTPCVKFEPEYRLIASSWRSMGSPAPVFFALLDYAKGRSIFGKFSITAAPAALYLHPTIGSNVRKGDPPVFDFQQRGLEAANFVPFIKENSGVEVTIYRPIDWSKHAYTVLYVAGLVAALRLAFKHVWSFISSPRIWNSITLVIVLMMTSGFMWNRIRHPAYIGGSNQNPEYVSMGFQNQLGVETQIIAAIYAICAFATVSLVTRVPLIQNKMTQRIAVLACLLVLVVTYSILLNLFKNKKNGGYPFKLLV